MKSNYYWTRDLPDAWRDGGLSFAITRHDKAGTAEWYVCACRTFAEVALLLRALNARP